jgi:hypothetical protein
MYTYIEEKLYWISNKGVFPALKICLTQFFYQNLICYALLIFGQFQRRNHKTRI